MKALSKKSLILVLSLVLALSALMFAFSFKSVKAETGTSVGTFTVMEAAQVRRNFDGQGAGLRFRVEMDYQTASYVRANKDTVTMGFIITPHYYFENRAAEAVEEGATPSYGADDYIQSIAKYVDKETGGIKVDVENKIYIADAEDNIRQWNGVEEAGANESYYVNGALVGILEKNLSLDFTVIAYIYDGTEYSYAVPSASFARNVYDTANTAYWDKANERESIEKAFDWYATKSYPIKINNKAQYEEFAKSTATDKFEGDYLQIAAPIDLGAGNGSELKVVSSNFAGTLSKASNGTLVYENTENVGEAPVLAEEGSAAASVLADTIEVYDPDKLNFIPSAENVGLLSNNKGINSSFVENANIPTTNINNIVNYTGDAFVYESVPHNTHMYLELPYTAGAYETFANNSKIKAVKFSVMIDATGENAYKAYNNNDQYSSLTDTTGSAESILSTAGFCYYGSSSLDYRTMDVNKWLTYVVPVENFTDKAFVNGTQARLSLSFYAVSSTRVNDIYLGNIEFLSGWDWEKDVVYNGEFGFTPSEEAVGLVKSSSDVSFVANADLPEDVANPQGYSGDAIKIASIAHNQYQYIKLNYTQEEYQRLSNQGYDAVTFSYLVTNTTGSPMNNDQTDNNSRSILSSAGYYTGGTYGRTLSVDAWKTFTVPTTEFAQAHCMGKFNNLGYLFIKGYNSGYTFDLYIGEIEFVKDYDWDNHVEWKGEYGFTPSADNASTITTSTTKTYTREYVANSAIPTAYVITTTDETTNESVETTYQINNKVGYTGDAIKVNAMSGNVNVYMLETYTPEEYTKLAKQGKFNTVRISFMMHSTTAETISRQHSSTPGMFDVAVGVTITLNTWYTETMTVEEFISTYNAGFSRGAGYRLFRASTTTAAAPFDIYLGNIEFITVTE